MHRVRQSLPYWSDLGWAAEVVCVDPRLVNAPRDEFLAEILPSSVPVHRVGGFDLRWARLPGLGTLGIRTLRSLRKELLDLLRDSGDGTGCCVYFSTTQFIVHSIAPELRRRFPCLALAMDYQDPWVNTYYNENPQVPKPGGALKFRFTQAIARRQEPRVLRAMNGITAVSPAYRTMLSQRMPWVEDKAWLVLPFGGAMSDFEALQNLGPAQPFFDPHDGFEHWVYVGRGGSDMSFAVRALFRAFRQAKQRQPDLDRVRWHFLGTNYAPAEKTVATIRPIAVEEGVGDWVQEVSVRIPYGSALRCMVDADALILPGSNDPGYSASKIYPCILARKPLLALFHRESSVHDILQRTGGGLGIQFNARSSTDEIARQVSQQWMESEDRQRIPATDWTAFSPYTDRSMTEKLSSFLDSLCQGL